MHVGAAEAVERLHLEMVAQGVDGLVQEKRVSVVGQVVREAAEDLELLVGDEEFGGSQPGELVFQLLAVGKLRQREFTGGVINHREAEGVPVFAYRGEVIMAAVIEQREVVDGAGRDDLGDLPVHDLAGHRFGGLLPDSDPPALLDEFGDVVFRSVVRDTTHGNSTAFGESHIEESGGLPGILEKHFVEVAEPEEEKHIVGKRAAHRLVLRHHGGELAFLAGHGVSF